MGFLEEKNAALLYKWRFNVERNSLWRRALCDKYKLEEFNLLHENSSANERVSSLWKDIMLVGEGHKYEDIVGSSSWFWVVGYGSKINKVLEGDVWCGNNSLKESFPRLYAVSKAQNATIRELRREGHEQLGWDLKLRRSLFVWEQEEFQKMLAILQDVPLGGNIPDKLL